MKILEEQLDNPKRIFKISLAKEGVILNSDFLDVYIRAESVENAIRVVKNYDKLTEDKATGLLEVVAIELMDWFCLDDSCFLEKEHLYQSDELKEKVVKAWKNGLIDTRVKNALFRAGVIQDLNFNQFLEQIWDPRDPEILYIRNIGAVALRQLKQAFPNDRDR